MANQEHFDLLKQGVAVWNVWRQEHPETRPDLGGANFHFANLKNTSLNAADLVIRSPDNPNGIDINSDFGGIDYRGVDLSGVDFSGADLGGADLASTNLSGANLSGTNLSGTNLDGAYLANINLSGANFSGTNLTFINLSGAILAHANLGGAILGLMHLAHANLSGANFSGTNLTRSNLSDADLSDADLSFTSLSSANFSGANLSSVNLMGANLSDANFSDANFSRIGFSGTIFARVDLSKVKGLETAIYWGPSIVDTKSVVLPHDESTRLHFLRGVGFTETQIEYLPSLLVPRSIEYSSLFISYAHQDEVLARRLHRDLCKNDVPCWFAPHDLRPGTPILRGIEEAIHVQEKFLLILSEHAVNSAWIEREVDAALHQEIKRGRDVLFPIRLDNTVLESNARWATRLQHRHIGDFTNWQDDAAYQLAFATLLRHLKVVKPPTP